jgi:hypothetical protein
MIGAYLAVFAALAIVGIQWRTTDALLQETHTLVQQSGEAVAEQQRFNKDLIDSLHELSERAGMLTSADLCPVRFRLRDSDGVSLPSDVMSATLEKQGAETGEFDVAIHQQSSRSGSFDFGLHTPGHYRLRLETADGMTLAHEFDVLPGVPVDRCVICPKTLDVGLNDAWAWAVLGPQCDIPNGVALLRVAPTEYTFGEWTWQPPEGWPELFVAATTDGQEIPFDAVQRWPQLAAAAAAAVAEEEEWDGMVAAGRELISLPYRYFEVREVICFARRGANADQDELMEIGSVTFGSDREDERAKPSERSNTPRWHAPAAPPRFQARLLITNRLEITCPQRCQRELRRLAATVAGDAATSSQ